MKKAGIITFHAADNFGAVLQAFALQQAVQALDVDAEILDYRPDYLTNGGRFAFPKCAADFRKNLIIAYVRATRLRSRLSTNKGNRPFFDEFRANHLRVTKLVVDDWHDLVAAPPGHHFLIAGSDQIWSPPPQHGLDRAFFLDFGGNHQLRIAYAASFGRSSLPQAHHTEAGDLLKRFDHLSVREESALEIVRKLTGRTAAWMPDPTLLKNSYDDLLIPSNIECDYLFSPVLRSGIAGVRRYVSQKLRLLDVVPFNPHRRWLEGGRIVRCGPREWLGYIKLARCVITNSFHGTVFCILFQKPFVFVKLEGRKADLNERVYSFLNRLSLTDRIVSEDSEDAILQRLDSPIDYASVGTRISTWRDEGLAFLRQCLHVST